MFDYQRVDALHQSVYHQCTHGTTNKVVLASLAGYIHQLSHWDLGHHPMYIILLVTNP
jgi:hypothetical protein